MRVFINRISLIINLIAYNKCLYGIINSQMISSFIVCSLSIFSALTLQFLVIIYLTLTDNKLLYQNYLFIKNYRCLRLPYFDLAPIYFFQKLYPIFNNIMKLNSLYNFVSIVHMARRQVGYLISFFQELIQIENALAIVKRQLLKEKGFHPISIFRNIAHPHHAITIQAMQKYLDGKTACNTRQLYEIFQKFDHSRKGYILQDQFCRQMMPNGQSIKKWGGKQVIAFQVQRKFVAVLNVMIKSCRVLDVWRKQLQPYQPYELFQEINKYQSGIIGPKQLIKFFLKNNMQLNQKNAVILHRSLLRRHYKQVNLEVFCQNLNPLQFGQYAEYRSQMHQNTVRDIMDKQTKYIQAKQAQYNFQKQINTARIKDEIHHQAALTREQQLQKRVQLQIQTYNQMKYLTKKKYNPHLTYEVFAFMEKQNNQKQNIKLKLLADKQLAKQQLYKKRISQVDVTMAVQTFRAQKQMNRLGNISKSINSTPLSYRQKNIQDVESQIRSYRLIDKHRQFNIQQQIQKNLLGGERRMFL